MAPQQKLDLISLKTDILRTGDTIGSVTRCAFPQTLRRSCSRGSSSAWRNLNHPLRPRSLSAEVASRLRRRPASTWGKVRGVDRRDAIDNWDSSTLANRYWWEELLFPSRFSWRAHRSEDRNIRCHRKGSYFDWFLWRRHNQNREFTFPAQRERWLASVNKKSAIFTVNCQFTPGRGRWWGVLESVFDCVSRFAWLFNRLSKYIQKITLTYHLFGYFVIGN